MNPHQLEITTFSRQEAADICGVSSTQLKLWIDRTGLFREKQRGRGHHMTFRLSDLFIIKAVAELINSGLNVRDACEAVQPYGIYRSFLHDEGGEFILSRNHEGRWVGASGHGIAITIHISTHELFRRMLPGLKAAVGDELVQHYLDALADVKAGG